MKKLYLAVVVILSFYLAGCATAQFNSEAKKASNIYADLGYEYMLKGLNDKAIANFRKSLEYFERNSQALQGLALIMQDRKEQDLAKTYFEKSLKIDAKNPVYLYNYALFLYEQKDYVGANEHLALASEEKLYKDRGRILLLYGLSFSKLEKYAQAEKIFKLADNVLVKKADAKLALLELYIKTQSLAKASEVLRNIDELTSEDKRKLAKEFNLELN